MTKSQFQISTLENQAYYESVINSWCQKWKERKFSIILAPLPSSLNVWESATNFCTSGHLVFPSALQRGCKAAWPLKKLAGKGRERRRRWTIKQVIIGLLPPKWLHDDQQKAEGAPYITRKLGKATLNVIIHVYSLLAGDMLYVCLMMPAPSPIICHFFLRQWCTHINDRVAKLLSELELE